MWYYKKYKRKKYEKEAKNQPKLHTLNEEKVNKSFEGMPCDMSVRYSNVLKTLYLTIFFCPLIPLGLPFGILSVFLLYWADKYNLLNRHNIPK